VDVAAKTLAHAWAFAFFQRALTLVFSVENRDFSGKQKKEEKEG